MNSSQLNKKNLSKTELFEEKQKLQAIYEVKENEVEKLKHGILFKFY